jgi:hypothetical protein
MRLCFAVCLALAAGGCGGESAADPDARPWVLDGGVPTCEQVSAIIGLCRVEGTGEICSGSPDEQREVMPLDPGDDVPLTVGPQGASMLVFAIETSDIFPGDPLNPIDADNPHTDIIVVDGDILISRRQVNAGFLDVPDQESAYLLDGLFLIVENGRALVGRELKTVARITDRDDVERCGELTFVVTQ